MQTFELKPHPQHPPLTVRHVLVEFDLRGDKVVLTYCIDGDDDVRFPPWAGSERADDLWRTTCFELFLKPIDGVAYAEFNFSPSGRWAAYGFDGRRTGMHALPLAVPPHIERHNAGWIVNVDLSEQLALPLAVGITAVIKEIDGTTSYWALAHAPGPPDFHNPDCFVARLPAPTAP